MRLAIAAAALAIFGSAQAAEIKRCSGGDTMIGLMELWSRDFQAANPDIEIRIEKDVKLAADGFRRFLSGEVDCVTFVREPFDSELAALRDDVVFQPVALGSFATQGGTHALAIYVNAANPLEDLSLDRLREILAQRTVGTHLYGMIRRRPSGDPPGIVNYLRWRVLRGEALREDLVECADLDDIVARIARDPEGIGFSGFGFAQAGVKALSIDGVAGTPETVASGAYPLTRQIYLMFRASDPVMARFLSFVVSADGQKRIGQDRASFLPLPHRGTFRIVGYNDMRYLMTWWNALFQVRHPGTAIVMDLPATRAGPPALASGAAIAPMGAEFSATELSDYRHRVAADPIGFRVAHDSLDPRALSAPLAIFVNAANPMTEIDLETLGRWFRSGREGVDLAGLGPQTALGSLMLRNVVGADRFAGGFRAFAQSREVAAYVASDPKAIGFAAHNQLRPGIKALALAARRGEKAVAATNESLRAGDYPLDRRLLIYARELDGLTRDYLETVYSPAGQAVIGRDVLGYLPLNDREIEACRIALMRSGACAP